MSADICTARSVHVPLVVRDVRRCDREEWVLASGRPFHQTFAEVVGQGGHVKLLAKDDHVLCVWGVNPGPEPGVGIAWLVGTNRGQAAAWGVQRLFRKGLREMHDLYPVLQAWAYERNHLHHHWMERLGFHRTSLEKRMGMGARFILFESHRET